MAGTGKEFRVVQAIAGAVGVGTALYGIGYLALVAHYRSLGIWAGDLTNEEVSEEGGRFLYHLVFLLADMLTPLSWTIVGVVVIGTVACVIIALLRPAIGKRLTIRFDRTNLWVTIARACGLAMAVVVSIALAETAWRVLEITDLLYVQNGWLIEYRSAASRMALYEQVLPRIALVGVVAAFLYRSVWTRRPSRIERVLVLLQWAITLSVIGLWPTAYGKLVISDERPTIAFGDGQANALLIRSNGSRYFVWNRAGKRLEVHEAADGQTIVLGPRAHLLE